jgi:hypothetical protein
MTLIIAVFVFSAQAAGAIFSGPKVLDPKLYEQVILGAQSQSEVNSATEVAAAHFFTVSRRLASAEALNAVKRRKLKKLHIAMAAF